VAGSVSKKKNIVNKAAMEERVSVCEKSIIFQKRPAGGRHAGGCSKVVGKVNLAQRRRGGLRKGHLVIGDLEVAAGHRYPKKNRSRKES